MKDYSCVEVCPVECIHPRKDEVGFELATMLYINPEKCLGCGHCLARCPVDAVYESYEATPDSQKDLIAANDAYRVGDPDARALAEAIVAAHIEAHSELMTLPPRCGAFALTLP